MSSTRIDDRALMALRILQEQGSVTTSTLRTELGARGVSCSEDAVVDTLQRLRAHGFVELRGAGRGARWQHVVPAETERRNAVDRLALRFGKEMMAFAGGTRLVEPLERLVAQLDGDPDAPPSHKLERRFYLHNEPAKSYGDHAHTLDRIVEALLHSRRLHVRYGKSVESKTIEPLTLVVYRRGLYLLHGSPPSPITCYAVERMSDVELGSPFTYPTGRWDPARYLRPWFGVSADRKKDRYVFRFDASKEELVRARVWHPNQEITTLPDGRIELAMRTGGQELERFALEWGQTVEVVAPPSFRARVRAALRAALAQYADDDDAPGGSEIP